MAGRILGAAPPASGPKCEIVRVTSTEQMTFFVVSTAIFGQWVHWYGHRSHECMSDKSECNGCQRGWPRKWKGYLHCLHGMSMVSCFLEITPACSEQILLLAPSDKSLRGVIMRVSKTRGGAKGRYIVDVLERRTEEHKLPVERDPLPILQYLWACKNQSAKPEA